MYVVYNRFHTFFELNVMIPGVGFVFNATGYQKRSKTKKRNKIVRICPAILLPADHIASNFFTDRWLGCF